ncbi:SsgA family sporulation/cell division regulator [Streptomyces gilvosporeus]|uniref:Regulator n=1 Tax=Streptomyces gilvosporeus TaxID=553510 RepID=A0A1V0U0J2_9ACTN|nr:SsgA family sporulation/cell division regulator [Streptomyces gilvosporeus]ARF58558.1 regulator [Streptomyces gilvosporeus]
MSTVIEQAVQARLITAAPQSRAIPAALRYDRTDPLAVHLAFPPAASLDGAEVVWTFGRDLLAEGLRRPAGAGDVRIWPCGIDGAVVEFHAAGGMAVVQFAARDLRLFLSRSYAVVEKGGEARHLDVDGDLADLLREA